MKPDALIAMVLTAGFVWGGFVVILAHALRKERDKGARGAGSLEEGEGRRIE